MKNHKDFWKKYNKTPKINKELVMLEYMQSLSLEDFQHFLAQPGKGLAEELKPEEKAIFLKSLEAQTTALDKVIERLETKVAKAATS